MSGKLFPLGPACPAGESAIDILETKPLLQSFVRVNAYTVRTRTFTGEQTPAYTREVMSIGPTGQAVVVLPYDPVRDCVILIEQFRLPSYVSGRTNGWTLEPAAGLIETGDTPEESARRECREECNRELGRLVKVGHYMPSPGAFTELIHLFIGEVEAGETGTLAGLSDEHEFIRAHVLGVEEALALVDSDRIDNGNALIALNWLARHRERLRADWRKPA